MGLAFDSVAASFALKEYYTDMDLQTAVFKSPALGIIPKDTTGAGKYFVGPLRIATLSSRSATAATAFTTGSPSTGVEWIIPWSFDFASANITGDTIAKTRNDEGAFVEAIKFEAESAMDTANISLSTKLWGNGGGSIGQISAGSAVGTATITLAIPSQAINFQVGQVLNTSATDGTSGVVKVGSVTLTAVNIVTGTLTASGNWTAGIATAAASDFIFNQGDFGAAAPGIPAFVPIVDPVGTYLNVNRAQDTVRTAGWRYSGGATKRETITTLSTRIASLGGKTTHVFMNTLDYQDLINELQTNVVFTTSEAFKMPQVSFPGIQLALTSGTAKVIADPYVPQGFAWLLDMSTWKFVSMGQAPDWDETDSLLWSRIPGLDQFQARLKSYYAIYCSNPGKNGVAIF